MPFKLTLGWYQNDQFDYLLPPSVQIPTLRVKALMSRTKSSDHPDDPVTSWALGTCQPSAELLVGEQGPSLPVRLVRTNPELLEEHGLFFMFDVEMPYATLEHIQSRRAEGQAVTLVIRLEGAMIPVIGPVGEQRLGAPRMLGLDPRQGYVVRHTFGRDDWNALLQRLGFADVMVFELPIQPMGGADPCLAAARQQLREAREALLDNDTDGVAHHAYLALDALAPGQQGSNIGVPTRIDQAYFSSLHPEVKKRLVKALEGLTPSIHVGRHAVGTAQAPIVDVTRQHAKWIFVMTSSVVGWCAALRAGRL